MAKTSKWDRLKNAFSFRKRSRSRSARRKKPKTKPKTKSKKSTHSNSKYRNPNLPSQHHVTKTKSKSTLFGCFTGVPHENTQSNIDYAPQTPNVSKSNHFSTPPPSPSSVASASAPLKHNIPSLNDINNELDPSAFRVPCTPSETQCFATPLSSKFIHENQSVHSVYSDHPSPHYNMTPTPHTFEDDDYDIYEGVLEVELDKIVSHYDEFDSRLEEDDDILREISESDKPEMVSFGAHPDRESMNELKHPPPESIQCHDVFDDDHLIRFMDQLNAELIDNGYPDPQRLLNEIWPQMENDQGAQMYQIWQHYNKMEEMQEPPAAQNFPFHQPPQTPDEEPSGGRYVDDMEDEDDDIKYEFTPQLPYAYPCHDTPHPILPMTPQYHEGPLRVTMESGTMPEDPHHDHPPRKSPSCESQPSVLSAQEEPPCDDNNRLLRSGSTLSDEPRYLDGEVFHNKYVIGHKINEGGFGSVWKINDNALYSKCVKIMELGKDEENQTRRRKACIREYTMTQKAFSDEIIEVELYIDNVKNMTGPMRIPQAYLIMPYFEGKDLFEFIDDEEYFKNVSTNTMLHIFYKIAEKLYDLHYFKKIVHGDLKPENVMILQSNTSDDIEVEIIDYGIAKSIRNLSSDAKYLKSKGHFGTKGYVAPELMKESKYNRKIDVFSAGVVLYNMVTECCLFPKGHKYYRMCEAEYYKYLKKKFKCIKKKKMVMNILYACLAFDPDERLDVKQLIERYFHSKR
eukprot:158772_1